MKIISLYQNEKRIIKKAAAANSEAQRMLYDKYAPKMLSVCRQYIRDLQFAEDVMISGFVKVFNHLDSFKHKGSFEGWIRKIMIRESIAYLRKNQFVVFDDAVFEKNTHKQIMMNSELEVADIQKLIDELPDGYKTVFILYAIESYKHAEIADMLGISESTSKTQLLKARKAIQVRLEAQHKLERIKSS